MVRAEDLPLYSEPELAPRVKLTLWRPAIQLQEWV